MPESQIVLYWQSLTLSEIIFLRDREERRREYRELWMTSEKSGRKRHALREDQAKILCGVFQ